MVLDVGPLFNGSAEELDFNVSVDLTGEKVMDQVIFPEAVKVKGKASAHAGVITLAYTAEALLKTECDLCLSPIEEGYEKSFSHTLTLEENDDAPVSYVACPDGFLDFSLVVLSDVFLSLPIRFVCQPGCKGLCDRCGKNLNEGPCECPKNEIDPRLLALQHFLKSQDED